MAFNVWQNEYCISKTMIIFWWTIFGKIWPQLLPCFFLLPLDSKVNNTKIKKGENLQICSKTWKSENCLDRGSNPGLRWQTFLEINLQYIWDLSTKSSRLHLEEELALFCCQKWVGGLGPGVSALPMGPMDVLENYIFEISMKNWKNEPEENFLEGFFNLTVSKKRGVGSKL